VIIGLVLTLYMFEGFRRHKTLYEASVYCAVASLVVLLMLGLPLDWLRDNFLRDSVARDVALALVWVALFIIMLILHRLMSRREEATREAR
jgi:hypothetical protein